MCSWREPLVLAALLAAGAAQAAEGVGRPATPAELRAWDIDVRPDFQGLPRGSGSVLRGQELWDAKCASCHGTFGESNEVFTPLVGGTTAEDQARGRVAALTGNGHPQRTTLMKVATVSTLFDYIRRAMPWDAPRSLSDDDTYAVLAYLLNLGDVVPSDFVLDQDSIRAVQQRLPNRNGMTRAHGLWDVKGKPDVRAVACMKDCGPEPRVASTLPDFARNAHGNLAEQNRTFGPVRGADTTRPAGAARTGAPAAAPAAVKPAAGLTLARASGCLACHDVEAKRLGPSFRDLKARYAGDAAAAAKLAARVRGGSQGAWGPVPMPPQRQVAEGDVDTIVKWVLEGAR
ncbi:c-type cytochrome [Anaeromyxobacter sp. PSR-1]|uniref:c-type cytochrome n=1 Tax=unclassified Anaeromyxobacter TaxID=2620896 RepID=UPI0005E03FDD|nr:c-type cytochrome [Anaeromyxobacter sp. PSR-1]GAO01184.1 cytochrome c-551 [Anaeromyxobacter sp. PSR-1]